MSFKVGEISEALALDINEGFNDDDKNAFVSEDRTKFYVKQSFLSNLDPSQYKEVFLTQLQVDGTTPAVKPRRIYP